MHKKYYLLITLATFISWGFIKSPINDNVLKNIKDKLTNFNKIFPQQKVFIHHDKNIYFPKETINFKAYLVNASDLTPYTTKTILYVFLLDNENQQIAKQKVRIQNGFTSSQIRIPDDAKSGNYLLIAFTNWMRNFDTDFYFKKEIKIIGDNFESVRGQNYMQNVGELTFFPEVGELVYGLPSRVGIKAVDSTGKGININGKIINNENNEITGFDLQHLGMGAIEFTPVKGLTYFAVLDSLNSKQYELPKPKEEGLVMSVDDLNNKVRISIKGSANYSDNNKNIIYLVLQSAGRIYYNFQGELDKEGQFDLEFPTSPLPQGIVQVTLFDFDGIPVCERLFFNDFEPGTVIISPAKSLYSTRDKINISLQALNENSEGIKSHLSVTVFDKKLTNGDSPYSDNIVSYFY